MILMSRVLSVKTSFIPGPLRASLYTKQAYVWIKQTIQMSANHPKCTKNTKTLSTCHRSAHSFITLAKPVSLKTLQTLCITNMNLCQTSLSPTKYTAQKN